MSSQNFNKLSNIILWFILSILFSAESSVLCAQVFTGKYVLKAQELGIQMRLKGWKDLRVSILGWRGCTKDLKTWIHGALEE